MRKALIDVVTNIDDMTPYEGVLIRLNRKLAYNWIEEQMPRPLSPDEKKVIERIVNHLPEQKKRAYRTGERAEPEPTTTEMISSRVLAVLAEEINYNIFDSVQSPALEGLAERRVSASVVVSEKPDMSVMSFLGQLIRERKIFLGERDGYSAQLKEAEVVKDKNGRLWVGLNFDVTNESCDYPNTEDITAHEYDTKEHVIKVLMQELLDRFSGARVTNKTSTGNPKLHEEFQEKALLYKWQYALWERGARFYDCILEVA